MAIIQKDKENGMYIGIIPQIPGAHTEAETLEELQKNLKEVLELCLEDYDEEDISIIPEIEGSMMIGVNVWANIKQKICVNLRAKRLRHLRAKKQILKGI